MSSNCSICQATIGWSTPSYDDGNGSLACQACFDKKLLPSQNLKTSSNPHERINDTKFTNQSNHNSADADFSSGYFLCTLISFFGWVGVAVAIIAFFATIKLGLSAALLSLTIALAAFIQLGIAQLLKSNLNTATNSKTLVEQNNEIIKLLKKG